MSQLRAAERTVLSFYDANSGTVRVSNDQVYFVCKFCGYLAQDNQPESCPICGAQKQAFLKS